MDYGVRGAALKNYGENGTSETSRPKDAMQLLRRGA